MKLFVPHQAFPISPIGWTFTVNATITSWKHGRSVVICRLSF